MTVKEQANALQHKPARLEILTYAPTEFFHCRHCEDIWSHVGLGARIHAEQRAGLLPPDLQAEYAAISDWVAEALDRHGDRLTVRIVDAASVEGLVKTLRYRTRRFPVFILDGRERIAGFDRGRLNDALARRLGAGSDAMPASERR